MLSYQMIMGVLGHLRSLTVGGGYSGNRKNNHTDRIIILSIIMTVIVLMQEGKNNGLGALTGSADTYWSKNKGRSMEGMLVKVTRVLLALFLIVSAVLTIGRFQ